MIGSTRWTAFCLAKPRPLGGTAPSIWLNHPIYWGLPGLQALHAHLKYTAGVQLCMGVSFHPNSQIGAVYVHAEAIQVLRWGRGAAPLRTLPQGGDTPLVHPRVYVLAQGACRKSVDFFSQSLLYVFGNFHTFGPFPERIVLFKWNRLWRLKASFAIKGLNPVNQLKSWLTQFMTKLICWPIWKLKGQLAPWLRTKTMPHSTSVYML